MNKSDKILVAGHTGLIGSALTHRLQDKGFTNLLLPLRAELDLTDSLAVDRFFDQHSPDYVLLSAGKVGGIIENQIYPADFMNTNLAIQLNVLRAAHRSNVRKLILFGSSCMYPRECPQPMPESALLSGHLEPTSLSYAVSKLAGVQMCLAYNQQFGDQRFIPLIPNSVFGPNDNFEPNSGHVLSALIRRIHDACKAGERSLMLWGSGAPRREFIHSRDIADACITLLAGDTSSIKLPLNLGTGEDISISELAVTISRMIGYEGTIQWDTSKPDGAPRKLLDSSRLLGLGWRPVVDFEEGLRSTYQWYLDNELNKEIDS
jgi:GDP-L-fucose synthase